MKPTPEQDAQFSAGWNADVGSEKIAEMYAEAFLDAARARSVPLHEIMDEFDSLFSEVFTRHPKFEEVLGTALIAPDEKIGILDRTLKIQASATFLNFLKVLAKHGRLDILRAIHRGVRTVYDRRMGRVPVVVTTAVPLEHSLLESLSSGIRALIGGEPVFRTIVDPAVIGGIVVRVGDTIYDASLSTQLKNVRQAMIDRSAHEIQSRRDRFSNTEGN